MELQTTSHCDFCKEPLGIKCDRDYRGVARALLDGLYVKESSTLQCRTYKFYCTQKCLNADEDKHT